MNNYLLVARYEYRRLAGKRSFLILTLAIPLMMAALVAVAIWLERSEENRLPIGYVDHAGFLDDSRRVGLPDVEKRLLIHSFPDEEAAISALENEEIQAVFVFPPDYFSTLQTELYFLKDPPSEDAWIEFDDFVRINLLATYPEEVRNRLLLGPEITVRDISSGRQFSEKEVINTIIPFAASFLFIFSTMTSSGYMLQAVTDEKENRTMEVVLTSMTSGQLIWGKSIGLLAVAFTQVAIYIIAVLIGLKIAMPYVDILQQAKTPWLYLGVMIAFFIPTYALYSGMMITVGSAVPEFQQGQQFVGLLNIIFLLPLFLISALFENPGSPLLVLLSLFPPTAFLTISLRWGFGSIPLWQLATSWILLVSSAIWMIWIAGRIFRIGMLSYGQTLRWSMISTALREK